jgi:two-component system copper resistance phosphate regulon response regulator CusR
VRILLAEDDQQLRDALARGLREQACEVDAVADGDAALAQALGREYDVLVLDVLMPGRDGFTVCRELRRQGLHTPILLLTARDAVDDRIAGLDAGADDYLTKPFAFGELLARLRALLRRGGEMLPSSLVVGDLLVDTRLREVRRRGRVVPLAAKEYAFLEYLARNAGRVVSRAEIAAHVWDEEHDPASNLIDVYVSRLRRKVDGGERVSLLHTRRNLGVVLAPESDAERDDAESRARGDPSA